MVFVIGTAGYVVLLGWSLGDALYMTVDHAHDDGFREVRDLDDLGRMWTSILSIAGVGIIFGTVGLVVEGVFDELTGGEREARRMADTIARLAITSCSVAMAAWAQPSRAELVDHGQRVVVVDTNQASLERARRDGHLVVLGDATNDSTLIEAGLARARGLVTTLDSDANNVYVVLSARAMQPDAVHRRPGQRGGLRGKARAGRCQPRRLAVHDGRPADRRAGARPPARGLHRPRPLDGRSVVLA